MLNFKTVSKLTGFDRIGDPLHLDMEARAVVVFCFEGSYHVLTVDANRGLEFTWDTHYGPGWWTGPTTEPGGRSSMVYVLKVIAMRKKQTIFVILVFVVSIMLFYSFRLVKAWPHLTQETGGACIVRLRVISTVKEEWALEQHKTTNDTPTWDDVRQYLPIEWRTNYWTNGVPLCPGGGHYTLGPIGIPPTCSIGGVLHSVQ